MNRREILKTAVTAALLSPFARAAAASAQSLSPLATAARDAWLFGLALIENAGSRAELLRSGTPPNRLVHARRLTTPQTQFVTTPNNDTLYSRAWINLNAGPVRLTVPKTGDRYMSVALMDMYTNNFAILGTRTTGGDGGTFTLVGPSHATNDPLAIRSPTPWVWMLVRVLIDGDADLPAATAIQDGFFLQAPGAPAPSQSYAKRTASWQDYFASVQALINENPPRATDDALLDRIAPLGIRVGGRFDPQRFTAAQDAEIEAGVAAAKAAMRSTRRQGRVVNGWIYPKSTLGDYGQDYFYRAQVSVAGLAALPPVEAMYMRPVNESGGMAFDSATSWRLSLPGNAQPPVDSFWSLTMYRMTPEGQFYFFDNPINRYAIGDRTPGLVRGADGSLDIWMSRQRPSGARAANWLPTPQEGPFGVVFRAYLPQAAFLDGEYSLPPLQQV
jgi:hypothetical protein